MSAVELNVPRCKGLLEFLETHPENHDQGTWGRRKLQPDGSIRTVMCAAGTAVMLAGVDIDWREARTGRWSAMGVFTASLPPEIRVAFEDENPPTVPFPVAAQLLLGLEQGVAAKLFYLAINLGQVKAVLEPLIEAAEEAQAERASHGRVMHQIFADLREPVAAGV